MSMVYCLNHRLILPAYPITRNNYIPCYFPSLSKGPVSLIVYLCFNTAGIANGKDDLLFSIPHNPFTRFKNHIFCLSVVNLGPYPCQLLCIHLKHYRFDDSTCNLSLLPLSASSRCFPVIF